MEYDYSEDMLKALLENDIIDEELYDKCSKPHIQELPYDGNANTIGKLERRSDAITDKINEEEKKIKELDKEIKKDKKEYNKLKKEYKETFKREYDDWKRYKKAFDNGAEDFFSYDWNESYVQKLEKTISEIDKEMKQISKLKFDDITEKDIKTINDLGNTITSYMKNTYDHKTDSMEMIWFEYGSILEETWDVASQGNEIKVKIENNIAEKEKSEKKLNDYKEEQKKNDARIDKVTE